MSKFKLQSCCRCFLEVMKWANLSTSGTDYVLALPPHNFSRLFLEFFQVLDFVLF